MLEPPFLSLLCECFPSPPALAKGKERGKGTSPGCYARVCQQHEAGSHYLTKGAADQKRGLTLRMSAHSQSAPAAPERERLSLESHSCQGFPELVALGRHSRSRCCYFASWPQPNRQVTLALSAGLLCGLSLSHKEQSLTCGIPFFHVVLRLSEIPQ